MMLFSNMIYSVMSHVKKEYYEKTQYAITRNSIGRGKTICFSEKDLAGAEWREEKEFILDGFSYDVITTSIVDGEKTYFCYIDKKDIIINSLLDFSKKLAVKKTCLQRQINLPIHEKGIFKTSGFSVIFDNKEFRFFSFFYLKIIYSTPPSSEDNHYVSIIIPPPEIA